MDWNNPEEVRKYKREYARLWKEKHPDRVREISRASYQRHKEKRREETNQWRKNNPDKAKAQRQRRKYNPEAVKAWRDKNIERARAGQRRRYRLNPRIAQDAMLAKHKRRARKRQNGGSYTQAEWDSICAAQDYCCLACGEKAVLTVDHIVPLSRGGSNSADNLQGLCSTCNSIKGTKTIDYRNEATRNRPRWKQLPLL